MISEPPKNYKTYKMACARTWWPTMKNPIEQSEMIRFSNIDEKINGMKQQLDKTDIK